MLSVIIPTYNRLEKLKKTLASAEKQTLGKEDFEVIVVDDGSTDGTRSFMENFTAPDGLNSPLSGASSLVYTSQLAVEIESGACAGVNTINLKYFFTEHQSAGQARNVGIEKSQGEIIFFCGDDTYLDKELLAIHQRCHAQNKNIAVLGLTLWDENAEVTDFMRYLAPAGPQFHYNTIRDRNSAGFKHFYTCNISLAKKWLEREKFDERFDCAFDDIELGLRLEKGGLKIIFEPTAKVFHAHFYDKEKFNLRMERVGRSAVRFLAKYKNNSKIRNILKKQYAPFCFFPGISIFLKFSRLMAKSWLIKRINIRYHWFWQICFHYAKGMAEELKG